MILLFLSKFPRIIPYFPAKRKWQQKNPLPVEIEPKVGEYSTVEMFGIFHAFRSFKIHSIDNKGILISAVSETAYGRTEHEPQLLRYGGFIGFSDSQSRTSDDGPSWEATDDLNFETVE